MIFLSYAKEDGERAHKIFSAISRPDRPVFYDKDALIPGMDWRFEIEEKVRQSNLIVILLSKHSVSKEGFVQREIRLALDRAEMMPDGRIFIIPVRLDDVIVPAKLAKYQWLDMPSDDDFFDLDQVIQEAWKRLFPTTGDNQEEGAEISKILLRERVVILLQGKNIYGDDIYTYLKLPLWKLQELRNKMRAGEDFLPAESGVVLAADKGSPSPELRAEMAREHNMIDVPSLTQQEEEARAQFSRDFQLGFSEGYKSVLGPDVDIPVAEPPDIFSPERHALREGIQQGLKAARAIPSAQRTRRKRQNIPGA